MTPDEAQIWGNVYAAILQGLAANPEVRHSWTEMRERAKVEATAAIRTLREKPL